MMRWRGMANACALGYRPQGKLVATFFAQFLFGRMQQRRPQVAVMIGFL
jgi:hypothetical protein